MRCAGLFIIVVALLSVAGCGQQEMSMKAMEPPTKPDPAPEMAKLTTMIGAWTGSAQLVSPATEKGEMMPEDEKTSMSFAGESEYMWTLDGAYLKGGGWHEMGDGQRMVYEEYVTWDAKAGQFHSWYFSNWGKHGESWWKLDPDGKTFWITAEGVKADGSANIGKGKMVFVDNDTLEWEWSEKGPQGKMELKGVNRRKK